MSARKPAEPKATEAEMLDLLEQSLAKHGNGGSGEYAFLRQVRNGAGFSSTRTFDGVSLGLWPSRGHDIHVYEVKVSRSDWQRELAKPDKAEDAAKVADRFSIVAPRGVVDLAELPAPWGYIEAYGGVGEEEPQDSHDGLLPSTRTVITGRKLRTVKKAPLLRPAEECGQPIPRGLLVAMLRAADAVPDPTPPSQRAIDKAVWDALAKERERVSEERRHEKAAAEALTEKQDEFFRVAGIWLRGNDARSEGQRVRAALVASQDRNFLIGQLEHLGRAFREQAQSTTRNAEQVEQRLAELADLVQDATAPAAVDAVTSVLGGVSIGSPR